MRTPSQHPNIPMRIVFVGIIFFNLLAAMIPQNAAIAIWGEGQIPKTSAKSAKEESSNLTNNSTQTSAQAQATASLLKLPLTFEANQGQFDTKAQFQAHGNGFKFYLSATETILHLAKFEDTNLPPCQIGQIPTQSTTNVINAANSTAAPTPVTTSPPSAKQPTCFDPTETDGRVQRGVVLRMSLVGANSSPQLEGRNELPGKANYLLGQNPNNWHTNISLYSQVAAKQVYPGIDQLFQGGQGELEQDFVVAAGADPSLIATRYGGSDRLLINPNGELVVYSGQDEIHQPAPTIYQDLNGSKQIISGGYLLKGSKEVGFQIGAYDHSQPLIIDPLLSYSTYLGGSQDDNLFGVAVDSSGSAYVTGSTLSSNFPTISGSYKITYTTGIAGSTEAFVSKLNASGSGLVYSTFVGGTDNDYGFGIAVDSNGNAYVAGKTKSNDFPTVNPYKLKYGVGGSGISTDAFVLELNAAGSSLLYSTYLGGSDTDAAYGIALDSTNKVYVTGYSVSSSNNFTMTTNAYQSSRRGGFEAFVSELDPTISGTTGLLYSTFYGGSGDEKGFGIAVGSDKSVYIVGYTTSSNITTTSGVAQTTAGGGEDGFVARLNPLVTPTNQLVFATYLGGSQNDEGQSLALDSSGNAYITGYTYSANL